VSVERLVSTPKPLSGEAHRALEAGTVADREELLGLVPIPGNVSIGMIQTRPAKITRRQTPSHL
jgi:hypothetical protein